MPSERLPSYSDSGVVEEIEKLMDNALQVQKDFADNERELERIDKLINSNLIDDFADAKSAYDKLFEQSRDCATSLKAHIDDFIIKSVNIVLSPNNHPLEERRKVVEGIVSQLREEAKEYRVPYDKQMAVVKKQLEAVREAVIAENDRIQGESKEPLEELQGKIGVLRATINKHQGILQSATGLLGQLASSKDKDKKDEKDKKPEVRGAPSTTKKPADRSAPSTTEEPAAAGTTEEPKTEAIDIPGLFDKVAVIGRFFAGQSLKEAQKEEFKTLVKEFDELEAYVDKCNKNLKATLAKITKAINSFSGLIGKLGYFAPVWTKLERDAATLTQLVEADSGDQKYEEVLKQEISTAVEMYGRIKVALDNYTLKVI